MEVNPMWFVAVGVIIALVLAYRHGKLAGFVAKVNADEAKFAAKFMSAASIPSTAQSVAKTATSGYRQTVEKDVKDAATKFGDELKGWTTSKPAAPVGTAVTGASTASVSAYHEPPAPQPTTEQLLAAVQAELDAIRALPRA